MTDLGKVDPKGVWSVDHVTHGGAQAQSTVKMMSGGTLDVSMTIEPGSDEPAHTSAEQALVDLLRSVFGEHSAIVDLIDLTALRFTYGRHPSGGITVWVKVPPPKGLPDRALAKAADKVVAAISKRRPRKPAKVAKGTPLDWGVEVADNQIGKATDELMDPDGKGTGTSVDRVGHFIDETLPSEYARLRRLGYAIHSVEVGLLGDITEGCVGSYDNQTFSIDLNIADQFEVACGIVDRLVDRLVSLKIPRIRITAVASNHDQNSRGAGKINITDPWDDRSFMVLRNLGRAYSKDPVTYGGVEVEMPSDPLVACITSSLGLTLARTHGHQVGNSGPAVTKMWKWWDDQKASGLPGAGGAQVLSVGHHHHAYELRQKGRILLGNPALDNGSKYLSDSRGVWSMPGLRTWTYDGSHFSTQVHHWPRDQELVDGLLGR